MSDAVMVNLFPSIWNKKLSRIANAFLLLMSLLFYAWGEPVYILVMLGSIAVNYCFGLFIHLADARGGGNIDDGVSKLRFKAFLLFLAICANAGVKRQHRRQYDKVNGALDGQPHE